MKKYLVTIEFRYTKKPKDTDSTHGSSTCRKITLGEFDEFEDACAVGNRALEVFESKFHLNENYNKKERFSKNGGCFGSKKSLITNLAYLRTPFEFYAKITTMHYDDVSDTIESVLNDQKEYTDWMKQQKDND
jgi:hypothetical protein